MPQMVEEITYVPTILQDKFLEQQPAEQTSEISVPQVVEAITHVPKVLQAKKLITQSADFPVQAEQTEPDERLKLIKGELHHICERMEPIQVRAKLTAIFALWLHPVLIGVPAIIRS